MDEQNEVQNDAAGCSMGRHSYGFLYTLESCSLVKGVSKLTRNLSDLNQEYICTKFKSNNCIVCVNSASVSGGQESGRQAEASF